MKIVELQPLIEAYDTVFDATNRVVHENNIVEIYGRLDGEFYVVEFKLGRAENHVLLALSFAKIVDGLKEYNLISSKNTISVLGAVRNIISTELANIAGRYQLSAILMFLHDANDQRERIYRRMFSYGTGTFGKWHIVGAFNISDNRTVLLATNGSLKLSELSTIKNSITKDNTRYWLDFDLKKSTNNTVLDKLGRV